MLGRDIQLVMPSKTSEAMLHALLACACEVEL